MSEGKILSKRFHREYNPAVAKFRISELRKDGWTVRFKKVPSFQYEIEARRLEMDCPKCGEPGMKDLGKFWLCRNNECYFEIKKS